MDKLIGSFVKSNINNFNLKQLQDLERFLSIDDDTLYRLYNNQLENLKDISQEFILLYKSHIYKK